MVERQERASDVVAAEERRDGFERQEEAGGRGSRGGGEGEGAGKGEISKGEREGGGRPNKGDDGRGSKLLLPFLRTERAKEERESKGYYYSSVHCSKVLPY